MGLGNAWNRALVYFGIAEEEDWEEDYSAEGELERAYAERPNVRRLHQPSEPQDFDDWSDPEPEDRRSTRRAQGQSAALRAVSAPGSQRVHLVVPRSFNDAQPLADRFKDGVPVILNLQNADPELSKRLIDFSSGLTYAMNGAMQRVADRVFLLTPRNVEVSAEERARLVERSFFNQA